VLEDGCSFSEALTSSEGESKRDSLAAIDVAQESDVSTHQASPTAESSVAGRSNAEQVTATETAVSPSEEVNASEKEQP
jgi:hypothetical protein